MPKDTNGKGVCQGSKGVFGGVFHSRTGDDHRLAYNAVVLADSDGQGIQSDAGILARRRPGVNVDGCVIRESEKLAALAGRAVT
jgi:hypothetical protein